MPIIKGNGYGTTREAIKFFERFKEVFGNIVSAEMKYSTLKNDSEFILINDKGDTMTFKNEVSSGYIGEGPSGTYTILKMAGFEIEKEFIISNDSFIINK